MNVRITLEYVIFAVMSGVSIISYNLYGIPVTEARKAVKQGFCGRVNTSDRKLFC